MLSCFSHVRLFVTPWTVARQAPLFMGFSRQEYWSGLSCPPSGDLPDPGIESGSPSVSCTEGRFFTSEPPGKFMIDINCSITKQFHSLIFIQVIYFLHARLGQSALDALSQMITPTCLQGRYYPGSAMGKLRVITWGFLYYTRVLGKAMGQTPDCLT